MGLDRFSCYAIACPIFRSQDQGLVNKFVMIDNTKDIADMFQIHIVLE